MLEKIKNNKTNYFVSLIVTAVIAVLVCLGYYWPQEGLSIGKLVSFVIALGCVVFVPMAVVGIEGLNRALTLILGSVGDTFRSASRNKSRTIILIVIFFLIGPLSLLISSLISSNGLVVYLVCAVLYLLYFTLVFAHTAGKKPERLFFFSAMILGTMTIIVTPATTGISWDDEIHYERTLNVSNMLNGVLYDSEAAVIDNTTGVIENKNYYTKDEREGYYSLLNESYKNNYLTETSFSNYQAWSLSYVPSALGILVARGLSLSFVGAYMLGKFFSLLCYAIVMYLAIKKLYCGKILLSFIGLIPTCIFLASAYSYDAWTISFIALGFAYFISMIQQDGFADYSDIKVMFAAFVLGFIAKAMYVPLAFIMFFMPSKKFPDKAAHKKYIGYVFLIVFIAISLYALSMLISGNQVSDTRGGDGVDAAGQAAFIFGNFGEYIKILFGFLGEYFAPANVCLVSQSYGWLGFGVFYYHIIPLLFVLAFLDKDRYKDQVGFGTHLGVILLLFFSFLVVATTLYIGFTPVGYSTINGCQLRYLLPLLFGFFYFIAPSGIGTNINRNVLAVSAMSVMSVTYIVDIYARSISLYC